MKASASAHHSASAAPIADLVSGIALADMPPFIAASLRRASVAGAGASATDPSSVSSPPRKSLDISALSPLSAADFFSPGAPSAARIPFKGNRRYREQHGISSPSTTTTPTYAPGAALCLESVQMRYGNGPLVLKRLTFAAREGTMTIIKGSSGCGKSSMFLALLGLYPICGGRIRFGSTIAGDTSIDAKPPAAAAATTTTALTTAVSAAEAAKKKAKEEKEANRPLSTGEALTKANATIERYGRALRAGGRALLSEADEAEVREAVATRERIFAEAEQRVQGGGEGGACAFSASNDGITVSRRASKWYHKLLEERRREAEATANVCAKEAAAVDYEKEAGGVERGDIRLLLAPPMPATDPFASATTTAVAVVGGDQQQQQQRRAYAKQIRRAALSTPADAWRALFSWVPQEPFMFEGSILENLFPEIDPSDLGEEHTRRAMRALIDVGLLTEEAIAEAHNIPYTPPTTESPQAVGGVVRKTIVTNEDAANYYMVDAEADAAAKPQNKAATSVLFPTSEVSPRGENLSGGERQRVGIARALLNTSARIFIMDEPTSHLDSRSCTDLLGKVKERLCRAAAGSEINSNGNGNSNNKSNAVAVVGGSSSSSSLTALIADPAPARNAVVIVISHQTAETAKVADQSITLISGEAFKK